MKRLKQSLRLIGLYFRLNLASALEYRASFWMQVFGMMLSNLSFVFFWWMAFQRIPGRIGTYDFADVMFIWALCSSAFGLANVVFGNQNRLTRLILQGELDVFLLQPKALLLNVLCARSSFSAWGDFLYGFALFGIVQKPGVAGWALFVWFVILGAVLITAITVAAHTTTFYFGNATVIGNMILDFVINFSIYPLGIYRGVIRVLLFTLIPAGFAVHVPLSILRSFSPGLLLGQLAFVAAYSVLACWFFSRGLRRYASGNLITTRL